MVRIVCSLTSFIVALLLTYRVGRVYDRWWDACNAFGSVGSGCVGLVRQAYTNVEDPYLRVGARQIDRHLMGDPRRGDFA